MSRGVVRALRVGLVVVPVVAVLLVAHLAAPRLREGLRVRSLPDGYVKRGEYGPYQLFARPGNPAAPAAAEILSEFTSTVLAQYGDALSLSPEDGPTQLLVFSDHEDLSEFGASELGSDFAFNGGFYLPAARAIGVVGDRDPGELVRPLFHEGTHMMLDFWVDGGDPTWSRWFDEGLASYFEASRVGADGSIRLGGMDASLLARSRRAIDAGEWPSVEDLVAAPASAWAEEGNWRLYSKAALLTHCLLEGDDGRRRADWMALYEREREPGATSLADLEEVLGLDADEIDGLILRHVGRLR